MRISRAHYLALAGLTLANYKTLNHRKYVPFATPEGTERIGFTVLDALLVILADNLTGGSRLDPALVAREIAKAAGMLAETIERAETETIWFAFWIRKPLVDKAMGGCVGNAAEVAVKLAELPAADSKALSAAPAAVFMSSVSQAVAFLRHRAEREGIALPESLRDIG